MAILLMILKIIGIILLVILGLILLIILLVLFMPISYRISGVHNENDTKANVTVRYMIVKALAGFEKGTGLDYKVKILFFQLFPKKEGKKKKNEENIWENDEDMDDASLDDLSEGTSDVDSVPVAVDIEQTSVTDNASLQSDAEQTSGADNLLLQSDIEQTSGVDNSLSQSDMEQTSGTDNTSLQSDVEQTSGADEVSIMSDIDEIEASPEYQKELEKQEKEKLRQQKKEEKLLKKQAESEGGAKGAVEELGIGDRIDKLMDKVNDTLTNIDEKYQNAMVKADHVMQLLDREYTQRTLKRVLKIVKRLFGTIKPKKSKGYLHMGFGSSADTGDILGKISMFYPLYGRWLIIEPDFYYKVMEGELDIKGRIYLFRIVGPAIGMILTRDFWRTVKLAKKI